MGGCTNQVDVNESIENQIRNLQANIAINEIKINDQKKAIEKLNLQITQGETDLKTNHFQYNEEQLKEKASSLLKKKQDKKLAQDNLNLLEKLNQNNKVNVSKLQTKLEIMRNTENVSDINKIMKKGKGEQIDELKENIKNQEKLNNQEKEIERIIDSGNKYDPRSPQNVEEYLNQILEN